MDWDVLNGLDRVGWHSIHYCQNCSILMPDLDPEAVHREYLERLGLQYPEDRTFVYPELSSLE